MLGFDWLTGEVLGAGLGAIGGLSSGGNTKTTSQTMDPRLAQYLFGQDGNSGLMADAASVYKQQMAQGGLNPMQTQGLNMRAQYLNSPQYKQTFDQMQQVGTGLLSAPMAGNPFTQGKQGAAPVASSYSYNPNQQTIQPIRPQTEQPQIQPAQAQAMAQAQGQAGSGNNSRPGSGGQMGTPGGQGIDKDVAAAALQAMALSENPALRALSPTMAMLLGIGGRGFADQQMNAMGEAGNKLAASQPLANLGIGTVSDASGNVRTYSSPATIAAADRDEWGGLLNNQVSPQTRGGSGGMGFSGFGVNQSAGGGLNRGFYGGHLA